MSHPTDHTTEVSASDPRIRMISTRIEKEGHRPESLIEVLHTAQNAFGYLPIQVLAYIAKELRLPPSRIFSTVTFYHFFSLNPKGEHRCIVCTGTACYVKGARALLGRIEGEFGIRAGQVTPDGRLGLGQARCVGACGMAPVVLMDDSLEGNVRAEQVILEIRGKMQGA